MSKIIGIVTARYGSTRFPGKPLVDIGGIAMVNRTYNQAIKANFDSVTVATDDRSIFAYCNEHRIPVCMTSSKHNSGTERCAEVVSNFNNFDFIVNIQGDEPFIAPETLNLIIDEWQESLKFDNTSHNIITPIIKIEDESLIFDPNIVKVTKTLDNTAMYFSRAPIPYNRDRSTNFQYWKHLGVYGYSSHILGEISRLEQGVYYDVEKLEQLKWLEHGYSIKCVETKYDSEGIDTPADLEKAIKKYGL